MDKKSNVFYCYSLRMYHFLCAFNEHNVTSKISKSTGHRYWTFIKSERLDRIIDLYNQVKHTIS